MGLGGGGCGEAEENELGTEEKVGEEKKKRGMRAEEDERGCAQDNVL